MAELKLGTTIGGSVAWHEGNDGSGSGLDADYLDGNHASAFALSGHTHNYAGSSSAGGSANSVANSITFTTSGGAAAGTTYNGSAAITIDYTTIGAAASSHTHSYLTSNQTITLSGDVSGSGATSISTTVNNIGGWAFKNTGSNSATDANTINSNGISYYTAGVDNYSGNSTDGALYSQYYSSSWQHQIAGDFREGNIAVRGKNNGTWARWKPVATITISDSAPANETRGDLWWQSSSGKLKIWYADANSEQWVDAVPIPDTSTFYSKAGGAITGPVVINSSLTLTGLTTSKKTNITASGAGWDDHLNLYSSDASNRWNVLVDSGASNRLRFAYNNSEKFYITTGGDSYTSGTFTASGNITAYSDISLKTNISVIENAIDKVKLIRGVMYNRTDLENNPRHTGVIAQEVEVVLPEVVSEAKDGIKSVAYGNMIGLLIEAIKEQQKQIEELKAEVKALRG